MNEMANPALAEVDVEDISRSSFLAKGALAVGAVYGMTMVGRSTSRRSPRRS
jgi:hypothetical protein